MRDYVKQAGGTTEYALDRRIYVLGADGTVRGSSEGNFRMLTRFSAGGGVRPGDVIVVPPNQNFEPLTQRVGTVTNILFQSFSSIAALLSITNQ